MPGTNFDLLILSDLHLGQGRDPLTGRVSRTEDFLFDDDFVSFLRHYQYAPEWEGRNWRLIINGDFIDFLQVTDRPADPGNLACDPRYGLGAGARESVWKLRRVVKGHPLVFQALAEFSTQHELVIVAGNHDIPFVYPEVQEALRRELESRVAAGSSQSSRVHLDFCPWFYFDGTVYAEHGHQYDPLNSFHYQLAPFLPQLPKLEGDKENHIDLPLGSLFVRYLFNRVEADTPFADNVKPATRFLGWFIRHHPVRALRFLFSEGREMLRRVRRGWKRIPPSAYGLREREHSAQRTAQARQLELRFSSAEAADWESRLEKLEGLKTASILRQPRGLRWRFLRGLTGPLRTPFLVAVLLISGGVGAGCFFLPLLRQVLPELAALLPDSAATPGWAAATCQLLRILFLIQAGTAAWWWGKAAANPADDRECLHLRRAGEEIQRIMNSRYVVMGHTHEPDFHSLGSQGAYFNTGTWTKVFDREDRLFREEKEFVFVLGLRTGEDEMSLELLKWEANRDASRLVYLY